jgi:hypothetical protein
MKYLLILILLINTSSFGKNIAKKECNAQKVDKPIQIDGLLDDAIWASAQWNQDFKMYIPYDNKVASEPTQFAIVYDQDFVYVAIKAWDSVPSKISRRLTRRDDLDGDYIGVQFDSYNDKQTSYCFSVSAAGTKSDAFISNDGDSQDNSWNPIWWVETAITDEGWVAEMKIPFSQFRFVNSYVQTWGIQIERYIQRNEETSLWQAKERNDPGWVHHYGQMNGLVDIQPKKTFDLYPYAVANYSTYPKEEGNPYADGNDWKGNVGLDGKVGLTNNLTLDFTINPDFGQVEADPSSVNLSGFELFFQEKRPFFIEGNNIINFPLMFGDGDLAWDNLFYSRRIGRNPHNYPELDSTEYAKVPSSTKILGAAKITGRSKNGLSIGIMESVTAKEKAEITYNGDQTRYETVEPATNYSVVSLQKDFGGGNTLLSGMVTSTNRLIKDEQLDYLHTNAYTAGLDFTKYWKDKTYFFTAKGAFSYVQGSTDALISTQESSTHLFQRPDAKHVTMDSSRTSLPGYGGNINFGKSGGGRLSYIAAVYFKSPGLELNDVGFVRHSDDIISILWAGYRINEPFSIFKRMGINVNHWSSFDFGGTYLGMGGNTNLNTTFKNNYQSSVGINLGSPELSTSQLRGGPAYKLPGSTNIWAFVGSDYRKKLSISLYGDYSKGFEDYYQSHSIELGITFKPWYNIEFGLEPSISRSFNEQQYVEESSYNGQPRYVLASIDQQVFRTSFRINMNLTPDLSIQYWGQPFFATGSYSEYKMVTDSKNENYDSRFSLYPEGNLHLNNETQEIEIDESGDGNSDYSISKPDFNTKVFLSNLVARWEYRPGSVLFLVWSQNRYNETNDPTTNFANNVTNMFNFQPQNTFLIKLSYRIGI